MKSLNAFSMALLISGFAIAGCVENDGAGPTATVRADITASDRAQTRFGVDQYRVELIPSADGNHVAIELHRANGARIGSVTTFQDASGGDVLRVSADGLVTDIVAEANTLTVSRGGVVRYQLDRAQATSSAGLAELEASAPPFPTDLLGAVGLAAVVVTDEALVDYLASVSPSGVAYLLRDCPWWVHAAACVGWETGVGAVMCAACSLALLV